MKRGGLDLRSGFILLVMLFILVVIILIIRKFLDLNRRLLKAEARAEQMYQRAIRDGMTGVYDHQYMIDYLATVDSSYSLLMLDIDDFKEINDDYGHQVGDEAIKYVARKVASNIRKSDLIGRYGGDEFIIILFDCNQEETKLVKQKIKEAIAEPYETSCGEKLNITVSIGTYINKTEVAKEALSKADQDLYRIKRSKNGNNKVSIR
ncbi:GGDEF domain-containing protein [Natroniella acetigena]|uniref:GGDEF domain-containing protein n=1 Tax=Natroniella acetigena TaxID=52004 RepID=UPI00200A8E51|nr:diguanylate cyclase [Natroniella acetigena]MCK8826813.1 GGDEF domain-containing protein [Natroniella acetigena]